MARLSSQAKEKGKQGSSRSDGPEFRGEDKSEARLGEASRAKGARRQLTERASERASLLASKQASKQATRHTSKRRVENVDRDTENTAISIQDHLHRCTHTHTQTFATQNEAAHRRGDGHAFHVCFLDRQGEGIGSEKRADGKTAHASPTATPMEEERDGSQRPRCCIEKHSSD